jgi:hypothetical protein
MCLRTAKARRFWKNTRITGRMSRSFRLKAGSYSSAAEREITFLGRRRGHLLHDGRLRSDGDLIGTHHPSALQEGSTTLRKPDISAKKIPGEIAEADYDLIIADEASAPVITPVLRDILLNGSDPDHGGGSGRIYRVLFV